MKDITLLNTIIKVKNSILTPFTLKLADLVQKFRVKVLEKWLVSLRNSLEKRLVSLRNGHEKWLVSLCNGLEKWLVSLRNHFPKPLRRLTNPFLKAITETH